MPAPHVVNEQIAVDADAHRRDARRPDVKADGAVKSVLQPAPTRRGASRRTT